MRPRKSLLKGSRFAMPMSISSRFTAMASRAGAAVRCSMAAQSALRMSSPRLKSFPRPALRKHRAPSCASGLRPDAPRPIRTTEIPKMALDQETLDQLRDMIRRYVRERLIPLEAQVAEEDRIPDEVVQEMRELGLFGLTIPEEFGGIGLNMSEEVQIAFELGFTSAAFRSLIGTNNGIGSQGIIIDGTPEQKQKYLPKLAAGESIASFALTEPEAGSDAGSLKTTARKDGDYYVIRGTKRFITNGPRAGLFTVFARTDLSSTNAAGVSAFLV